MPPDSIAIAEREKHEKNNEDVDLKKLVGRLAELLPSQGPITAFAFLNPLQGLEGTQFLDALSQVKAVFDCEPFLEESAYREKMLDNRITEENLSQIVSEELRASDDRTVGGLVPLSQLRMSMLRHSINPGTEHEVNWLIGETGAMKRFRPEMTDDFREKLLNSTACASEWWSPKRFTQVASQLGVLGKEDGESRDAEGGWETCCLTLLWDIVCRRMTTTPVAPRRRIVPLRHRDLLLNVTMQDSDLLVNEVLIRFCSVFLDQGFAHWKLPQREMGFFKSFVALYSKKSIWTTKWLRPMMDEVRRIREQGISAMESLAQSLNILGVENHEVEEYLRATLLALRGWAGMIWQTESRPDRVFVSSPDGTLIEFLAVRFLLERFAIGSIVREYLRYEGEANGLRHFLQEQLVDAEPKETIYQRSYPLFQIAQLHGWSPRTIAELSKAAWFDLVRSIESFSDYDRRRTFHLAFERNMLTRTLNGFSARANEPIQKPECASIQVVTCIDAREESFRRHLEEVSPDVETFGNAGFFCIPMYFRGAGEAHFTALSPIVVKPQHWIVEDVVHSLEESDRQRAVARRALGTATHRFNTGTRDSVSGALLTACFGPLFTIPLVGRILFPRLTAKMHRTAINFVAPPAITRLRLERPEGVKPSSSDEGIGFTLSEMVNMTERSLRDIGLISNFARLVLILGHGSNCLNNPHESAYQCGACSGSPGGANARALAAMANDPRVRKQLASRGLVIPDETHFLGGLHNTATEAITFFELELMPTSHVRDIRNALKIFSQVAERNAHERCRRFESASLELTPIEALQHVENRAVDLAQTRPEYGNSTNAICFVGRRSRIRGLYLDRRSFQMSYDASQDTENSTILARILGAVIPVCEGINLLYTFSAIDSRGWGSGTKLPHNVTSLLGVMDGAASDLRPGLPWQGVDIHEPMRLLFIIESTPDALLRIMNENTMVGRICRNGWAQLAVLDPHSNRIQRFVNGHFVDYVPSENNLPIAENSMDWYRGQRANLPFAMITGKSVHLSLSQSNNEVN
ncbi:MAG: DUF2309 domain-containing protein [Planctomycetota bacterium]|nr:DUF2309 domain-containing protein [Planctomycetota bacterium]